MEKQKTILIIAAIFLLLLIIIYTPSKPKKVCINENCFNIELAETPLERSKGLMDREDLLSDSGMLFIFDEEDNYAFWMKNTLITLDIIWIDGNKEIVFIEGNAQPCEDDSCESLSPNVAAKYVLEINGGLSKELGITEGDEVKFYLD